MNPLQEHAHLFANGDFRIKDEYDHVKPLEGVHNNRLLSVNPPYGLQAHFANQCTLIARPIEDMTDEEIIEFEDNRMNPRLLFENDEYSKEQIKQMRHEAIEWHELGITAERMIYYLSIGVYPFDQAHFEDGTVIDSTTL